MKKKLGLPIFDGLMRISVRFYNFSGSAVHSILGIMAVLFVACGLLIGIMGRGWAGAWLFVLLGLMAGFFPILNFIRNHLQGEWAERAEDIEIAERIRRMLKRDARDMRSSRKASDSKNARKTGRPRGVQDTRRAQDAQDAQDTRSELEKELDEIDRRTASRAAGYGGFSKEEWETLFKDKEVDITQEEFRETTAQASDVKVEPKEKSEPVSEIDKATRDLESALLERQKAKEDEKRRQEEHDRLEAERMERIRKQQEEFRRIDEEKRRVEREAMEKLLRQRREKEAKEYKAREKRYQQQQDFERARKGWGSRNGNPASDGSKIPEDKKQSTVIGSGYFAGVDSLSGLKKRYKELMKEYHPDNGSGNLDAMTGVQREYDELLRFFKKVDSHK